MTLTPPTILRTRSIPARTELTWGGPSVARRITSLACYTQSSSGHHPPHPPPSLMLIMARTLQLVKQIFLMFPETTGKHIFYILFVSVTTVMLENAFLCNCMYCRVCVFIHVCGRAHARVCVCVLKNATRGGPDTSTSKCM